MLLPSLQKGGKRRLTFLRQKGKTKEKKKGALLLSFGEREKGERKASFFYGRGRERKFPGKGKEEILPILPSLGKKRKRETSTQTYPL